MRSTRLDKENIKAAGLGVGIITMMGGTAIASSFFIAKMEQQMVEGLKQAPAPGHPPVMIGPSTPMKQTETHIGPTAGDYVVPGGVALTELGIAGYALWRLGERRVVDIPKVAANTDDCQLTLQEAQTFATMVSRFHQTD